MEASIQLLAWLAFSVILIVMMRIAQFYEKKSGNKTLYQVYPLAIFLFVVAALIYSGHAGDFVGEFRGDTFLFLGGLLTLALSAYLFELMMGRK
jgi:hypothetical protein